MYTYHEHTLATPTGKLWVRHWTHPTSRLTPILLFHDSLGCIDLWRDFPERLSQVTGRTVIAYDRLGFGRSDRRQDKLTKHFISEEAEQFFPILLDHIQSPQLVVMGHSVGGGMAVHCAAYFPEICKAVITLSAQAFFEHVTKSGIEQAKQFFSQPTPFSRLEQYHGDKTAWVLDAWISTWLSGDFDQWSLDQSLALVQCPALVMHGEHDEYGSILHPQRIANGIGTETELVILPETKHFPHREKPDQVLGYIAKFLAKIECKTE